MPSFEEEAFERARKLSHSRGGSPPRREEPPKPKPAPKPEPEPVPPPAKPTSPNMMETLLRDKETSLILMLLLLLTDEKSDPTLIFSLMYLLM